MICASPTFRTPRPVSLRNVFQTPTTVDGTRPRSTEAFARSHLVSAEHAIRSASPATLLSSMKNAALPEHFTSAQKKAVANLLDKYHPRTLAHSLLIDARGAPIPLHLASTPLTDSLTGQAITVDLPTTRGLVNMFTNYRQHLNWEAENLSIRKIGPGEAEPELTGQEGVFATKDIPPGTAVSMFGGMYLTDPKDIELDAKIRNMAGIGAEKYHVPQEGGRIQGMGVSMKLNAIEDGRSNLSPVTMNALDRNGEEVKVMGLFTSKPIKAGEELRFAYNIKK